MKATKQLRYNRINILLSLTLLLLFPFISNAQLFVTTSNNVGIGTSSTSARLTLKDAGAGIVNIGQLSGNSGYSGIAFTQTSSSQVTTDNYSILGSGSHTYLNSGSGGNIYFRNQNNAQMIIQGSNGRVGIGTTAPDFLLDVQGGHSTTIINSSGDVKAAGVVLTSDQMFKTNIDSLHNALATIRQLKPKSYYFDTLNFNGVGKFNFQSVKQYGFIANEVQTFLPELVSFYTKPAVLDTLGNIVQPSYVYRALNYNAFIAILAKGIQELQQKNDSLQSKTNHQDSIIASLQNQVVTNNTLLQNQLNQLQTTITDCCNRPIQKQTSTQPQSTNQIDVELNDAQSIVLDQNSPNPFSEQTTINYSLPDNTIKAQMLFYNAQGKLIQSTELTQKGKGTLNVFASDLSSGIYTYTLVVDGKIIETKKMVKQ